jgi:peptidoglycan-associated lipoprotein
MMSLESSSYFCPAAICPATICPATRRLYRRGRLSHLSLFLVIFSVVLLAGCPSKTPVAKAPPPPPPPAPTATIEVTPSTVQAGQPVTITWKTENVTDVSINPVGAVQTSGSQTVTPTESTTYHITARGPGGAQEADARVTVTAASEARGSAAGEEAFPAEGASRLDIFFDTNDFSIRDDQFPTIKNDADFLKQHPEVRIIVEGHCDEMGSTEYNLALGDRRAAEVKAALQKAGVNSGRMRTISYGKEHPFCQEQSDDCWRMNRRAHIVPDMQR